MANSDAEEYKRHLAFVDGTDSLGQSTRDAENEDTRTTPLFTSEVRAALKARQADPEGSSESTGSYSQYGLLGMRETTYSHESITPASATPEENLVYANMNSPWSAFICGSQGGGKSHTLSCLLENSLVAPSPTGALPNPLAGILFHYDKFTSASTTQICEAAYLCSSGVSVRVLVSPSNYYNMARAYSHLPGMASNLRRPEVLPLYLQEEQLNVFNMKTLMAATDGSKSTPLYLEVLFQILRDMAMERRGKQGVDYAEFKNRLNATAFSGDQSGPMKLRLQLLESLLDQKSSSPNIWSFKPGTLTIIDPSDPLVSESDACALFSICLALFMENRDQVGRVVALDEAHKFLTQSGEALNFTDDLVSIIRQQRHLATRVLIATQEPTLSPTLLDLCNVTIVHRFLSPAWFETIKRHLAGARSTTRNSSSQLADLFKTIVGLQTGQALLFSPTALLNVETPRPAEPDAAAPSANILFKKLQDSFVQLRIRKRISADGGKSIMASDAAADIASTSTPSGMPFQADAEAISHFDPQPLSASRFQKQDKQRGKKKKPATYF